MPRITFRYDLPQVWLELTKQVGLKVKGETGKREERMGGWVEGAGCVSDQGRRRGEMG